MYMYLYVFNFVDRCTRLYYNTVHSADNARDYKLIGH